MNTSRLHDRTGKPRAGHKGLNLPRASLSIPAITEKDRQDLRFAIEVQVDAVALSFVRSAAEVLDLKEQIRDLSASGRPTQVIAKMERASGAEPRDTRRQVIDIAAIAASGLKIGVDPMGGASVGFWQPIADMYGLNLEVVNPRIDPTFSFMTVDKDGKIRMDCSSPYAMAGLVGLKDRFDIAFGNDTDSHRHGIVTRSVGLMNPNHYLSVAIWYLFQNRPGWRPEAAIGKTLVSSSMIDRVAAHLGRQLAEVPVGFKWFVDELLDGSFGFGGEASAGASFLRQDGTVWTTDKDGIILDLLAAEITAVTGRDPGEHYRRLTKQFGDPVYERSDVVATAAQKAALERLSPEMVIAENLAGDKIIAKLTRAPFNEAAIGGLKVVTTDGWFAARPSGTEEIYKVYAES